MRLKNGDCVPDIKRPAGKYERPLAQIRKALKCGLCNICVACGGEVRSRNKIEIGLTAVKGKEPFYVKWGFPGVLRE